MKILNNRFAIATLGILLFFANLNAQKPTIISFLPNATCQNERTTVFITGENLTGATAVSFGGIAADSFNVNSSSSITAYVNNGNTGNIVVKSPNGTATSDSIFTFGKGYTSYAYVGNEASNTISVINTELNTVTATINVDRNPLGICVSPDGTKVYVTNWYVNTVNVINTATNTITATVPVGKNPYGICISPNGKNVYVANEMDSTVSVINTSTNMVTATIALGHKNLFIMPSPDGSKIYVSGSIINTADNTVTTNKALGAVRCLSPDGTKAFIKGNGSIIIFDIPTNTVIATIVVGTGPNAINVSPDGKMAYVTNGISNNVSVINTSTNLVVATIPVGGQPWGVSVTSDGKEVYVANAVGNTVSVINTSTNLVVTTIASGQKTFSIGNFIATVPTACSQIPEPITISLIKAEKHSSTITLNWHTSTEQNTSHFIIQHSTDGSSFTDISTVKAIGSGANGYQYTDNNPTNGINYYRLKSVDKDGAATYSKVVSVQFTVNSNQLSVFPNPAKSSVTISGKHIVSVQVVDNMGKIIKIVSLKDATNPTLSVGGLPVGVYHLRILTTDGKVSGVGFVKQ